MKMVSKMQPFKAKFDLKSNSQLVTISDSFGLFEEFDWHVIVVFQRCKAFKMTFKMAAITGWGITCFLL